MDKQLQGAVMDPAPIEAVEKARAPIKFRLPEMKRKGHTVYEFDPETNKLVAISAVQVNIIPSGHGPKAEKVSQTVTQHKFKGRLNCIYVQALNEKNAWKKIRKTGIDV